MMPDDPTKNGAGPAQPAAGTITELSPAQVEVETIIHQAQAEGSITAADLAERLSVLDLNPDETDAVYQRLV